MMLVMIVLTLVKPFVFGTNTILRWNGGQADHGTIQMQLAVVARVVDVQRAPNGQALHTVEGRWTCCRSQLQTWIDHTRRHRKSRRTTQRSPLHAALLITSSRTAVVLLTNKKFLRFDFTYFEVVTQKNCVLSKNKLTKKSGKLLQQLLKQTLTPANQCGAMALLVKNMVRMFVSFQSVISLSLWWYARCQHCWNR